MADIVVQYSIEYFAFNRKPKSNKGKTDKQHDCLFNEPITLFGEGQYALNRAQQWVHDANLVRYEKRNADGVGLELDNFYGEFIDIEVRSQVIVRFPYQVVEEKEKDES